MTETIEHAAASSGASEPAAVAPATTDSQPWHRTTLLVAGLVAVAGGIPLAMALGVLHQPRWYPLLDLAQTELRVRDVASSNPPLVGLAGRFDAFGQQGSHLGPLSFWSLWPFYVLFGSTAWALQAASACLNLLAMGTATWIAHRRGGARAALVAAVAVAVLARAYGAAWLTEAWNPYMPMLWWVVFLLAVWSVLCDDLPMLPVAVFAGSFCMQTHIPYLGLVGGLAGLTVAALAWWFFPRRHDVDARRRLLRWGLPSLALLVVLWVPPVIDQVTNDPGNLSIVREELSNSDDQPVGVRRAVEIWTGNLDVTTLVTGAGSSRGEAPEGLSVFGVTVLLVWAAAAVLTWTARHRPGYRDLLRLHLVVAVALALGLVSAVRILGFPWYYLVLWSLGTTTLLVVAVVWTGVLAWRDRLRPLATLATGALVAVLAVNTVAFTYDASSTEIPAVEESRTLSRMAPQVVEALRSGDVPGGGVEGTYLVRWEDTLGIGAQGYGLLLELERQGFDVGVTTPYKTGAVAHRERPLAEASATVNYVNGGAAISRWDDTPGAVRVAHYEPRDDAEKARFEQLHDDVVSGLRRAGLDDLAESVDTNLFVTANDPRVPAELRDGLTEMMDLGLPTAVYVAPPDAG